MNCIKSATLLNCYLDDELDNEQARRVWSHIATCQHCSCRFQFAFKLKHLLHNRCTNLQAPQHLRNRVVKNARDSLKHFQANSMRRK